VKRYAFRIVNVFAEERLAGNPLAVFENGEGLDSITMQKLALQFNLSETTFILPSSRASAQVRIFTPTFEMPFAGHPTLGTSHVVRSLVGGETLSLEMKAGLIPVSAQGDVWTLQANAPRTRPFAGSRENVAAALGIAASDVADSPLWVDTGSDQLVVPLASVDAVRRCAPDAALIVRHCAIALPGGGTRAMAYVWAQESANAAVVRFFFSKHGAIIEDPGTGSACANLGGWLVATGKPLPRQMTLVQGEAVGRRCELGLHVDAAGTIRVSGRVVELGRGTIEL
jgi:PhzF family phenazine biosynthesis protein